MLRKDNFIFGLALGLVAPVIGFLFYKLVKFKMFSVDEMIRFLRANPNMITGFISISLIANGLLFTLFINKRSDQTGKGIFVMTIVYALIALGFKYL